MFQKSFLAQVFAVVLFVFVFIIAPVYAAPGDLDPTFGSGGKVVTPVTPDDDNPTRVRIQSDGKIVTLGNAVQFDEFGSFVTGYFIVRHNADGTLDTSFGTNGVVTVSIDDNENFYDFVILPDGKFLVVGETYSDAEGLNIAIFRYLANGTRDAGFGTNGIITTRIGNQFSSSSKITLQPDGKFVVIGFSFNGDNGTDGKSAVVRYNFDGTLDTAFGTNGVTLIPYENSIFRAGEILVQLDSKILVAGHTRVAGDIDFAVLRYNVNGTLDSSFGTNGIVRTDVDNKDNLIGGMGLQSDGKIVISGAIYNSDFTGLLSSQILRYNTNGTLDTTFGAGGIVRIVEPPVNAIVSTALAIQQNDKILTAGVRNGTYAVLRYNPNGTIDTSFGTNGIVITPIGSNPQFDRILALALQPDGKIVAAGGVNNADFLYDVGLVRYLGDAVVKKPADFDGDRRSDLGVFRPSNGIWYASRSMQSFYAAQFGQAGDQPAPADYDGDGKTDFAVWREGSFAYFYILNSSDNTFRFEQFGQTGDSPIVVGDWDGDGKADPAVYRAATTAGGQSFFYYRPSAQPGVNFIPVQWGTNGDEAARGDFDGDGRMDAAVYRPSNQTWYIRNSSDNSTRAVNFGASTDKRVPGDFDGDGKTDIAVFRPSEGSWYILLSASNQILYVRFGLETDTLVPADYDGDGKTDVAVYRNGVWYIRQSTGGTRYANFGSSSDVPIASVFVR